MAAATADRSAAAVAAVAATVGALQSAIAGLGQEPDLAEMPGIARVWADLQMQLQQARGAQRAGQPLEKHRRGVFFAGKVERLEKITAQITAAEAAAGWPPGPRDGTLDQR